MFLIGYIKIRACCAELRMGRVGGDGVGKPRHFYRVVFESDVGTCEGRKQTMFYGGWGKQQEKYTHTHTPQLTKKILSWFHID